MAWTTAALSPARRANLRADHGVRAGGVGGSGLADVVEERRAARDDDVGAQVGREHRGDLRGLHEVGEDVLSVGRPQAQGAEGQDQLGAQPADPGVVGSLLTGDPAALLGARDRVGVGGLDPARVDAPVGHECLERDLRDLAPLGVEAAEQDGRGHLVDDDVHAGQGLERPDVAALLADDPALHLLRRQLDAGDRELARRGAGEALECRGERSPRRLLCTLAGRALQAPTQEGRVPLRARPHPLEQELAGLVRREVGDVFQARRDDLLVGGALGSQLGLDSGLSLVGVGQPAPQAGRATLEEGHLGAHPANVGIRPCPRGRCFTPRDDDEHQGDDEAEDEGECAEEDLVAAHAARLSRDVRATYSVSNRSVPNRSASNRSAIGHVPRRAIPRSCSPRRPGARPTAPRRPPGTRGRAGSPCGRAGRRRVDGVGRDRARRSRAPSVGQGPSSRPLVVVGDWATAFETSSGPNPFRWSSWAIARRD